jgi:thiosulfate dehydrogenase
MTKRTRRRRAGLFLAPVLLAALPAACAEPDPVIVQGTAIDHGSALYSDPTITGTPTNTFSCATCHQTSRAAGGSGPLFPGAPLAGVTERPSYWGGTELDLLRSINHCLYYFMLANEPWEAEDERARAMFAYLESLPSDAEDEAAWPFTVVVNIDPIPNGDAGAGAKTYDAACRSCHGAAKTGEGRGVPRAPILPDDTLDQHPLGSYTEAQRRLVFVQKTRHGGFLGYGGQMPPFSKELLTDAEIGDVLAFLGLP